MAVVAGDDVVHQGPAGEVHHDHADAAAVTGVEVLQQPVIDALDFGTDTALLLPVPAGVLEREPQNGLGRRGVRHVHLVLVVTGRPVDVLLDVVPLLLDGVRRPVVFLILVEGLDPVLVVADAVEAAQDQLAADVLRLGTGALLSPFTEGE
ncbi:hypothetical protein [Streptomyces sp. NPDC045369]|uniref:hypothetical protein n=1 Tax=Streptomyces sp. NPDC045369 TaxID=3155732 RepID=UPI0033D29D99